MNPVALALHREARTQMLGPRYGTSIPSSHAIDTEVDNQLRRSLPRWDRRLLLGRSPLLPFAILTGMSSLSTLCNLACRFTRCEKFVSGKGGRSPGLHKRLGVGSRSSQLLPVHPSQCDSMQPPPPYQDPNDVPDVDVDVDALNEALLQVAKMFLRWNKHEYVPRGLVVTG